MKKLSTILISILLILNINLFANNANDDKNNEETAESSSASMGVISGRVIDSSTGEALSGATVSLEGTNKVAFTDFDGRFYFQEANLNSARISANFISYEKTTANISGNSTDEEITLKLKTIF
ncbi:MAG: carboxypeptidase-like regulatory domain-containing protein [Bacteroidales bacterium]